MKSEQDPGTRSRRQHDRAFKEELVRKSLEPGASVSAIALRNGINANMLFKWRREHRRAVGMREAPWQQRKIVQHKSLDLRVLLRRVASRGKRAVIPS